MIYCSKILGWTLVFIILALAFTHYISRKKKGDFFGKRLNILFLKYHKQIGIICILLMLIHGKLTMKKPDIFALLCLLIVIFLFLSNSILKKNYKIFRFVHKSLTLILLFLIFIHILHALL